MNLRKPTTRSGAVLGAELVSAGIWALVDTQSLVDNAPWAIVGGTALIAISWFWNRISDFLAFTRGRLVPPSPFEIAAGTVRELREIEDQDGNLIEGFFEIGLYLRVRHKGLSAETIRDVSATLHGFGVTRQLSIRGGNHVTSNLRHGEELLFKVGTTVQPMVPPYLPSHHYHLAGRSQVDRPVLELCETNNTPTRALTIGGEDEIARAFGEAKGMGSMNFMISVVADNAAATEKWYKTNLFAEKADDLLVELEGSDFGFFLMKERSK